MSAADSVNEICTLRIELCGSDPLIWRQVEVPTSITLNAIDELQIKISLGRIAKRRNAAKSRVMKQTT